MKKFFCLLVLIVFATTTVAFADSTIDFCSYSLKELIAIRAEIDSEIAKQAANPATKLIPGNYVVGRDLEEGAYVLIGQMDKGPDGYTPQALVAESMDAVEDSEYIDYQYVKTDEKWRVSLYNGNVLVIRSGDLSIEKAAPLACSVIENTDPSVTPTSTLFPGSYVAGKDIKAGTYVFLGLMNKGLDGYTPQALIAESLDDLSDSEYKEYEYLEKNVTWRASINKGNVLVVRSGDITVQEVVPLANAPEAVAVTEEKPATDTNEDDVAANDGIPVLKGTYYVGRDINPGSYNITITDTKSVTVATFASQDDLVSYTSWDSVNNLKENAKSVIYAKKNEPSHLFLEDGDLLYISDGNGILRESDPEVFTKGLYTVGKEIAPGSYLLTITDINKSAFIATFNNMEDALEYVTWDSGNNLIEYGKLAAYAKEDEPLHIYLEEGDCLYIKDGYGTITASDNATLVNGVYQIGTDLKAGSYTITLTDFHNSATVATFKDSNDLCSYISWDSVNNLKEYSSTSLYAKKNEDFHITLVEGEYLYISDGTGNYTVN